MKDAITTNYDETMDIRIEIVKELSKKSKREELSAAEEISLLGNVRILDDYFGENHDN